MQSDTNNEVCLLSYQSYLPSRPALVYHPIHWYVDVCCFVRSGVCVVHGSHVVRHRRYSRDFHHWEHLNMS